MGRPKSYDRATVLDRALPLFWAKGYEGTHLSELVEETGLNRFSLYNEFGGKEGLFRATLDHYLERLGELLGHLEREPLGLANVRAYHRALIDFDFLHGCFALNLIREKHVVPPRAWETVEAGCAGWHAQLVANLRAAVEAGELQADRDPEVLATLLNVFEMGLLSHRSMGAERAEMLRIVEETEDRLLGLK